MIFNPQPRKAAYVKVMKNKTKSKTRRIRNWFKSTNFICKKCGRQCTRSQEGRQKDTDATTQHLYSKIDIRRFLSSVNELWCYKCNQEHNSKETKAVGNYYFQTIKPRVMDVNILNFESDIFKPSHYQLTHV